MQFWKICCKFVAVKAQRAEAATNFLSIMETPPFVISADAVNLIAEISALLERLRPAVADAHEVRLRKANRVKTIHSSLAIEGNTLSENQVRDIINGKQIVAPIRQIQEVRNAVRTYDLFSRLNPFSERDMLFAHSVMMEALADDAGHYRRGGVGVYGETGLVHLAPPPHLVPTLMHNLFEWLEHTSDHLLIRSCVFHYEFEFIHPFSDGNGRMGRLWQSLILGRLHPIFEHLPVENMVYANQQAFYDAIAASSAKAHSGPFIDFMLSELLKALQTVSCEKVPNKVPNKSVMAVLELLRDNAQLTRAELAQRLALSDSGVKRILAKLKASGLIERLGSNKSGRWQVNYQPGE